MGCYSNRSGVLIKRPPCEDTDTQEEWFTKLQAKSCQKLPANHQKPGRGKRGLPYKFQNEYGGNNTLILEI